MSWWNPLDVAKRGASIVGTGLEKVGSIGSSVGGYIPVIGDVIEKGGNIASGVGGGLKKVSGHHEVSKEVLNTPPISYREDKACFIATEVYGGHSLIPKNFYEIKKRLPLPIIKAYYKLSPFLIKTTRTFKLHRQVKFLLSKIDGQCRFNR